jgi:hypothetical protein
VCNMYPSFLDSPGIQHAANYTGVHIKPAPPVFDPMLVADKMVELAQSPKPSAYVHVTTPMFKLAYSLMPRLTRRIMEKVMSSNFRSAPAIANTDGNLFAPVSFGNAVHGGWNSAVDADNRKKGIRKGMVAAGLLATGLLLLRATKY